MPDSEEQKFYLVRPSTNVRALTREDKPLIVTADGIEAAIESLDHIVTPKTGRLEAVPVEEFHERWDGARSAAKRDVHEAVYGGDDDGDDVVEAWVE